MKYTIFALLSFLIAPLAFSQSTPWVITKTEWTAVDEDNYSHFISALGSAKCYTVNDCVRSPANPYRDSDPARAKFWSDCADWPYFLRSYFAWKNGLPFSYTSGVATYDAIEQANPPPPPSEPAKKIDARYSNLGNYPISRQALLTNRRPPDFLQEVNNMQNTISSAMMRVGPDYDGKILNDFYSPEIKKGSIRPGTVIYDPNGHVAVVYEVAPDGQILYFDAHPDNSVTHGLFNAKFVRSRPGQGAGLKNFRPQRLVGAKSNGIDGTYVGGHMELVHNKDIPDFGTAQYYGTQPDPQSWSKGAFSFNGKQVDVYEYIRATLASAKINPVTEFESSLSELCDDFKERRDSVEFATKASFHLNPHPATLPANLFGADGDWENYSTPGRDTRLKTSFLQLQKSLNARYQQYLQNDYSDMEYDGADLKADLLLVFHNANYNCPVSYTNSVGKVVNISLELGIRRLYALSFDPYNCPERRWGATTPEELKTCKDDANKTAWYNGEQRIRNYLERDWSAPQDITLSGLAHLGSEQTSVIDVRAWLMALTPKGN